MMRMNLTDLFYVTFLLAVGLAGLVAGRWLSWIGITVFLVVIVGQVICLFVTTGRDRAGAIGFVIPCLLYAVLILGASKNELGYYGAVLPHSQFLQSRIASQTPMLGNETQLWMDDRKRRAQSMMPLGHLFVAVIIGYAGGRFAEHAYTRSRSRQASSS